MKSLRNFVNNDFHVVTTSVDSFEDLLDAAFSSVRSKELLSPEQEEKIKAELLAREKNTSSALGHEAAVPHCCIDSLDRSIIIFVRNDHHICFADSSKETVRYTYILLGPVKNLDSHLDVIPSITRIMNDDNFRYDLRSAENEEEIISAFQDKVSPKKVKEDVESEDPFAYSGSIGGGIVNDVKRRLKVYKDDFIDGLHSKSVASIFFLFFACFAPAVTFGGVMASQTGGAIGAVEMIVASAFCGVIYALISGQPLIILGGTGPLLVFTAILYSLCQDLSIPFLPAYAWVGIWIAIFSLILAVTDASCLMRYFTRFTDETFAALISVIFIYEAIKALVYIFLKLETHYHHDTALLSLLLAMGTYAISANLRSFRRSRYLLPKMREFLADFGPSIGLIAMTGVAFLLQGVYLDVLAVPDSFGTTSGREWWINPFDAPMWIWFASAIPAVLATVLVFLDQNITARIVNSPDHKLHKGHAYHLDVAIVGVLIGVCSLFGLPWLVAATVRSLNHVQSLATVEEVVTPGGERRDQIIHVRENRVTGLLIHTLVGASLLALPLLKLVPMAVLYGLFLYMGIVSMKGNQFFERLSLWFMDSALYPTTHYVRKVPMNVIHKFTFIQLIALSLLWLVKMSAVAILFPLFIAVLVPLRLIMERYFEPQFLEALDAEEEPYEEEYRQTE